VVTLQVRTRLLSEVHFTVTVIFCMLLLYVAVGFKVTGATTTVPLYVNPLAGIDPTPGKKRAVKVGGFSAAFVNWFQLKSRTPSVRCRTICVARRFSRSNLVKLKQKDIPTNSDTNKNPRTATATVTSAKVKAQSRFRLADPTVDTVNAHNMITKSRSFPNPYYIHKARVVPDNPFVKKNR
jgi:hypothetical protein